MTRRRTHGVSGARIGRWPPADRRGAALVLALWVLLVLGMASLQILAEVRVRVDTAALSRSQTVGRYAAESGVEAARALLDGLVRSAPSPSDEASVFGELERTVAEWGQVPIGTGRYQVVVEDLNSRIDLNRSSDDMLEGLLAQFVSPGTAGTLVRTLRGDDFTDEDDPRQQAQGGAFGSAELGPQADVRAAPQDGLLQNLPPWGRPLMHLEELTRVAGFGEDLVASIAPYVTVSSDGQINANTAPEPVLAAVPYLGDVQVRSLMSARERSGPLTSRVALYSTLSEGAAGSLDSQLPGLITTARRVLVVARGWEEGHPHTHEVQAVLEVVTSSLARGPRVRVRSWSERGR